MTDLRDLCLELGLDWKNYPHGKQDFVRELLIDLDRKQRMDDLLAALRDQMSWVQDGT